MGYLNNSSVTVDAILTLKGRELLAKGGDAFKITQFAVGDDEIDYTLWNPDHPLGTSYYGTIIENMPITEAIPDETQALKYKLVTLPKQTTNIPVVSVGNNSIILPGPGTSAIISPNTANLQGGNANLGYTAILSDSTVAELAVTRALQTSVLPTVPRFIGDNEDAQSVAAAGFSFRIAAKTLLVESKTATITIIGNETGGATTINLTVNKASTATISNSAS
tara:strand:+ start:1833 stop:2498 length:666 start_codon:yes stop_codon:yes gene_type:complete